jgi:hypothetical protein
MAFFIGDYFMHEFFYSPKLTISAQIVMDKYLFFNIISDTVPYSVEVVPKYQNE